MLKVLLFAAAIAIAQSDSEVEKAFKDNQIVPDMLDLPPKDLLWIDYLNYSITIHLGTEVKPSQLTELPDIDYSAGGDLYYTFLMTDLDVPSRENHTLREILHCMIGNIPGSDVSKGEIFADYLGPAPSQGSGLHRYVFILFIHTSRIIVDPEEVSERANFSTKNFIDKHDELVITAGNFLLAQNENN